MTAKEEVGAVSDESKLLRLYELMLRVRWFEERVAADFRDGRIPGIAHLSIGQEAVAAGVSANLRPDDYVATTHRGHGHLLAKGAPADALMAEIWGRATGVCGGKGGSMHIAHVASGGLGANSIVGAGQPFAAGVAMAIRQRGQDRLVASYFGDGAITSGAFHEGLTMARVFSLPLLYVAENNGYSETTGARFHLGTATIGERLAGYGMRSEEVDGMDAVAVSEAAADLCAYIRAEQAPALLECRTYRYHGHFEGDPMLYRTDAELAQWRERDPIPRLRQQLDAAGLGADADTMERAVAAEMDAAAAFAAQSPFPDPAQTLEGVLV
jgi:TPP-dependent pyruvate/acetoin dehydrogenase alpha subunit